MLPQGEKNIYVKYKGNMQDETSKYHMKQIKSNCKFILGYRQAKTSHNSIW